MCESNAFLRKGKEEALLMENVVWLKPAGGPHGAFAGSWILRTLWGREKRIKARLTEIDLLGHKLVFEEEGA